MIDARSRADAIAIVYEPVGSAAPQKTVFEPYNGDGATHERIEYTWSGCAWRRMGSERVELIEFPVLEARR